MRAQPESIQTVSYKWKNRAEPSWRYWWPRDAPTWQGEWDERAMRRPRLQQADFRTAARQQGLDDADRIAVAIVDRYQTVSIIEKE